MKVPPPPAMTMLASGKEFRKTTPAQCSSVTSRIRLLVAVQQSTSPSNPNPQFSVSNSALQQSSFPPTPITASLPFSLPLPRLCLHGKELQRPGASPKTKLKSPEVAPNQEAASRGNYALNKHAGHPLCPPPMECIELGEDRVRGRTPPRLQRELRGLKEC